MGAGPLQALGRRSYSVYLWHWPVIVCTRPGVDWGLTGTTALVARLALIAVLSEASYRLVEQPVRDGRVQAWLAAHSPDDVAHRARLTIAGATALLVFVAVLAVAPQSSRVAQATSGLRIDTDPIAAGNPTTTTTGTTMPAPSSTTTAASAPTTTAAAPGPTAAPTTVAAPEPPPTTPAPPAADPTITKQVTLVGESVSLGAARVLQAYYGDAIQIDAVEGRSFEDDVRLIEGLAAQGRLTPWVIVHIGNNGAAPAGALDRVVAAVGPDRRLVLVNVSVPRRWEEQVNGEIARVVDQQPNAVLADWWRLTHQEEGLLVDDGVHLTRKGQIRYRDLLVAITG